MYGRIRSRAGLNYQITPEDALWLARSVECEGGDPVASAWTMIWRFAYFFRGRGRFMDMIRAFSQPVNPRWEDPNSGSCVRNPNRCSPALIARRQRCRTFEWSQMRHADLVQRILRAEVPNPVPRAIDFSDPPDSARFLRRNPDAWVVYAQGNWYLGTNLTANLPLDAVWIEFEGRRSGVAPYEGACLQRSAQCRPTLDASGQESATPPGRGQQTESSMPALSLRTGAGGLPMPVLVAGAALAGVALAAFLLPQGSRSPRRA